MNRPAVRYPLVLVAFSAVTILWLLPLVAHLGSSVSNEASDATSGARDYWAAERQGATPFTLDHDRLMDAPEGTDVSAAVQIANGIQPAFVLVAKELVGFVAALNLYMLLGFVLSGFLMFVLLDRLGLHVLASAFGGYVYALSLIHI